MYPELKNKVAVITGASRGIDAEITRRLAKEGMNVVINYYGNKKEATDLSRKINSNYPGSTDIFEGDVSEESTAISLIDKATKLFGSFDLLVNNAGIQIPEKSHRISPDDWKKVIDTNLTSSFMTSSVAVNYFLKKNIKGNIINISSVHEIIPWPGFVSYAVSKGGMRMLTQSLALEYASKGIRINAVGPGAINTPMNAKKMENEETKNDLLKLIPMRYIADPDVIANTVTWLASDQSKYITGQTIFVDGGMTLYPSFQEGRG
ncbi:TPA: glucose 1-dehydrogenase [Morganella morganii]|nr:glucose 1-dehydrogenase [Morganella morganii]